MNKSRRAILTTTKDHKVNITGYLSIVKIDMLDGLAEATNCSRNNLIEEAVTDLLEKKKDQLEEYNLI